MRILLTNDDGYGAPGIEALAEALSSLGDITIVAPQYEQSAKSHAITLDRPLRLKELGQGRYALDGTPSDCVYMGLHKVLREAPPDLVCSGINHGPNVGSDVIYSGTVAAAIEAALYGVPAIAFSLVAGKDYEGAARLARKIVKEAMDSSAIAPGIALNVNFPEKITGDVEVVRLGRRSYGNQVVEREDPRGKKYLWFGGSEAIREMVPGTDCMAVYGEGKTSITPLSVDSTHREHLEFLKQGFFLKQERGG